MERKKEEPFIPATPDTVEEALMIYSVLQDITKDGDEAEVRKSRGKLKVLRIRKQVELDPETYNIISNR